MVPPVHFAVYALPAEAAASKIETAIGRLLMWINLRVCLRPIVHIGSDMREIWSRDGWPWPNL
jgi:hypothetical protein